MLPLHHTLLNLSDLHSDIFSNPIKVKMRLFSTPKTSPELVRHAIVDDNIDNQCVILLIFLLYF